MRQQRKFYCKVYFHQGKTRENKVSDLFPEKVMTLKIKGDKQGNNPETYLM